MAVLSRLPNYCRSSGEAAYDPSETNNAFDSDESMDLDCESSGVNNYSPVASKLQGKLDSGNVSDTEILELGKEVKKRKNVLELMKKDLNQRFHEKDPEFQELKQMLKPLGKNKHLAKTSIEKLLWEINFSNGLNAIVERLEDITYEIDLLTEEAKVLDVKRQELEELQMKIDIIKEDQKDSEKIAQE